MLHDSNELGWLTLRATDGDVGRVETVYFDDRQWSIRYIAADVGRWTAGRRALIPPAAVRKVNWADRTLEVSLTGEEVREAAHIDPWGRLDAAAPDERQRAEPAHPEDQITERSAAPTQPVSGAPNLCSADAVKGSHLRASDGTIGHVESFLFDDQSWTIQGLVVDTSNWPGGDHVLLDPSCVRQVDRDASEVHVSLTREAVHRSPRYSSRG